ncbi:hypothetical protein SAMN02745148_02860 [Modicisalibacter ilicicola DSM 19980]|uniref:Rubrerythrin n=1 Tax=Modicisalibacter ilicicola DSM 19980 TaxID=1121942 RepID=A0A1M5CAS9_9GAMM|nr:hypothetical protein [Halomonas ilicicola]SHF51697.1 hypothetical protein SAMN02745148_02860 [Halomonas ilicicola DSM 19980]
MQEQARPDGGDTLQPAEVLVMTMAHENRHIHRGRILALRFQPFDRGIFRLMQILVDEGMQRLERLHRLAQRLQCPDLLATVNKEPTRIDPHNHFFVIDRLMACVALSQALQEEGEALNFYSQLCRASRPDEVGALLDEFAEQRLIHCQILQECRQRLQLAA